ncbi:serine/arginine repetitive matrix protein 1-like [Ostrinia furnacalis]|uniref:serine/arginine repetitive matrix protein 1-like n=1 Tax=Ostrinia furnacalis TaxID=93504 RepID=UPI00103BC713|nr:serine/arginine repetitive matrix protein 1-like [Ostrinia furnacalis]
MVQTKPKPEPEPEDEDTEDWTNIKSDWNEILQIDIENYIDLNQNLDPGPDRRLAGTVQATAWLRGSVEDPLPGFYPRASRSAAIPSATFAQATHPVAPQFVSAEASRPVAAPSSSVRSSTTASRARLRRRRRESRRREPAQPAAAATSGQPRQRPAALSREPTAATQQGPPAPLPSRDSHRRPRHHPDSSEGSLSEEKRPRVGPSPKQRATTPEPQISPIERYVPGYRGENTLRTPTASPVDSSEGSLSEEKRPRVGPSPKQRATTPEPQISPIERYVPGYRGENTLRTPTASPVGSASAPASPSAHGSSARFSSEGRSGTTAEGSQPSGTLAPQVVSDEDYLDYVAPRPASSNSTAPTSYAALNSPARTYDAKHPVCGSLMTT